MLTPLATLSEKLDELLETIGNRLGSKLGRNEAAVSANKLTAPTTIDVTGDVEGSVTRDGSTDSELALALKTILASPGFATKVEVDVTGRVIGIHALAEGDIPNLPASKITTGTFNEERIPFLDASKVNAGVFESQRIPLPSRLSSQRSITLTGDIEGTIDTDFSGNISIETELSGSGVTAGTYGSSTSIPSITVNEKGQVISVNTVRVSPPSLTIVNQFTTILAGGLLSYDLIGILGQEYVNYNLDLTDVIVKIRDTTQNSPLLGYYVNSEAMLAVGKNATNIVSISNQSSQLVEIHVKIVVHPLGV